jgi:hypothetical protein
LNVSHRLCSDWHFSHEPFDKLSPSNEFEDRYTPHLVDKNDSSETNQESVTSLSSNSSVYLYPSTTKIVDRRCSLITRGFLDTIKTEHIDLHPVVNLDRHLPASPPLSCPIILDQKAEIHPGLLPNGCLTLASLVDYFRHRIGPRFNQFQRDQSESFEHDIMFQRHEQ